MSLLRLQQVRLKIFSLEKKKYQKAEFIKGPAFFSPLTFRSAPCPSRFAKSIRNPHSEIRNRMPLSSVLCPLFSDLCPLTSVISPNNFYTPHPPAPRYFQLDLQTYAALAAGPRSGSGDSNIPDGRSSGKKNGGGPGGFR